MNGITIPKIIAGLAILLMMSFPTGSFARVNSVIGGLSTGYDYSPDSDRGKNNKYENVFLSPLIRFSSTSEKDSFRLEASPSLKYDLEQYNWDWDSNLRVAADRFVTKDWKLGISNHYLVSDYFESGTDTSTNPANPSEEVIAPEDPELSSDSGRQRYWRNTLDLFSNYVYREDSFFRLNLGYVVLRNDGNSDSDYDEYDRYSATLRNGHRYNVIWSSVADFQFVVGDFKNNNSPNELSDDVKEYRLLLALDNESIIHNPIRLSFDYIGARYDESEQDDSDIFQSRLTWRRDYSPRLYTRLGAGPSYSKIEGQNGEWGGNGIAELHYDVVERGFLNLKVEKNYNVENFSGSNENQSGVVDTWATTLAGGYQLQEDLNWSGRFTYRYEDREELSPRPGDSNNTKNYHYDVYIAGTGLRYSFLQFYAASVDYTWTKQDSDRDGDNYNDHRVVLTLSWQQELFHW
jgi:hypothetical protein